MKTSIMDFLAILWSIKQLIIPVSQYDSFDLTSYSPVMTMKMKLELQSSVEGSNWYDFTISIV